MFRYPDNANHDLLERIPLSAGVVLDVGCNTGALGAAYRRFNPRARLLGIEKDPVAAERASHRLDQVAVVDVEENPLPFTLDRPIDCIVYGDIIEHLRDPWAVLRQQAEALSDDGTMLICVPNMQHWSFADRLLRGTWKYEPSGLLDETHLRWFSLETVREGLEAAGLVPHDVAPRTFDAAKAQEFASMIAPALTRLGVDPSAYAQRAAPLQYVWRVLKRPRPLISIAANMLQPIGGVSHVRVVYPLQAMRSDPAVLTHFSASGEIKPPGGEMPRVFVLHRPTSSSRRPATTTRIWRCSVSARSR
jgi:SAM-dependent methyltransferase